MPGNDDKEEGLMGRTLISELFREMVSRPPQQIDLATASLLLALDEYPNLSVQEYLLKIDNLSAKIQGRLNGSAQSNPMDVVEAINQQLFEIEGFRGNEEDYYDPRNSFLNEVLDRRTGIPITLSVLYMEIGKRVGLKFQGVGMPGHFIVKTVHHGIDIFVDPFGRGEVLLEKDCKEKLAKIYGETFRFERTYLNAVDAHQILVRMLANLKAIYFGRQNYSKALAVIEKILLIQPDAPEQIRDRGSVHYKLNHLYRAVKDWGRYLELQPQAPDAKEVETNLKRLGHLMAARN
jgi:regulator of sirC expression with transglutaminase-like and TPR domain